MNYITGFPHETATEAGRGLEAAHTAIARRFQHLRAELHHNTFQLERLSPMATDPARFGIRVTRRWPWASVMDGVPL